MLKRFVKRINLNFKQSRSDRSATNSYRIYNRKVKAYNRRIKELFDRMRFIKRGK